MKKNILIATTLFFTLILQAQWSNNGTSLTTLNKVGIGTTNPSASVSGALLEVNANGDIFPIFRLGRENGIIKQNANYDFFVASSGDLAIRNNGAGYPIFIKNGIPTGTYGLTINNNGNIGIGTVNPNSKLHIEGSNSTYATILNTGGDSKLILGAVTNRNIIYSRKQDNTPQTLKLQVNNENNFVINADGKIGIGTTVTGNHKLAVEGSIGAREIKVEAFPNWSDFVFENNYNLPSLEAVENHIKEKGHLKDIPSAKDVKKDGFFLGEMDAKLLQKIEELTLYTIEQDKEIKELKKQNVRIEKLEALVHKLLKDKN